MKVMPTNRGGKVRGDRKEKEARSAAGVPNPLAAIRGPILTPLIGSGAEAKCTSHTQVPDSMKDAKGASTI